MLIKWESNLSLGSNFQNKNTINGAQTVRYLNPYYKWTNNFLIITPKYLVRRYKISKVKINHDGIKVWLPHNWLKWFIWNICKKWKLIT